MASSPVTSWQIDGDTMKRVTDFSFLGSKITEDCNVAMKLKDACSLEEKEQEEEKTNLDSILKSRDIILPTKFHLVKAMVFPVVTYGCESWTVNKAEH